MQKAPSSALHLTYRRIADLQVCNRNFRFHYSNKPLPRLVIFLGCTALDKCFRCTTESSCSWDFFGGWRALKCLHNRPARHWFVRNNNSRSHPSTLWPVGQDFSLKHPENQQTMNVSELLNESFEHELCKTAYRSGSPFIRWFVAKNVADPTARNHLQSSATHPCLKRSDL